MSTTQDVHFVPHDGLIEVRLRLGIGEARAASPKKVHQCRRLAAQILEQVLRLHQVVIGRFIEVSGGAEQAPRQDSITIIVHVEGPRKPREMTALRNATLAWAEKIAPTLEAEIGQFRKKAD